MIQPLPVVAGIPPLCGPADADGPGEALAHGRVPSREAVRMQEEPEHVVRDAPRGGSHGPVGEGVCPFGTHYIVAIILNNTNLVII